MTEFQPLMYDMIGTIAAGKRQDTVEIWGSSLEKEAIFECSEGLQDLRQIMNPNLSKQNTENIPVDCVKNLKVRTVERCWDEAITSLQDKTDIIHPYEKY